MIHCLHILACPHGSNTYFSISSSKHILRSDLCTCISSVCSGAAAYNHLDILKYFHKNGCTWNVDCIVNAVIFGHLDKCSSQACDTAVINDRLELLKYLREVGCYR